MKKIALYFLAVVLTVLLIKTNVFAADKLGFVDLSRIFSEYSKTKDYDKVLGDKEQAYNAERDKRVAEIKSFQEKMNLLSDKEKEAKKTELDNKVKAVTDYDRQQQTDLRKDQDEKMKEILKDIEEAVKQYSEKEGYTLVFNDRVLVYQSKTLDITDRIVEILNKTPKK